MLVLALASASISLGLCWLSPAVARAQIAAQGTPDRVLIARVAGDGPIIMRLRAELGSYNVRVVELGARPEQRTRSLPDLAAQHGAGAAMRAMPAAMAVELWVSGGAANLQPSSELVSAGPGRDPEVLATRVTEAMRARGLSLPPPPIAKDTGTKQANAVGASEASRIGETATPIDPAGRASVPQAGGASAQAPATDDAAEPIGADSPHAESVAASSTSSTANATDEPRTQAARDDKTESAETPEEPAESDAQTSPEGPTDPSSTNSAAISEASGTRPGGGGMTTRAVPDEPFAAPAEAGSSDQPRDEPARRQAPDTERSAPARRASLLYLTAGPSGVWSPGTKRVGPSLDALLSLRFHPDSTSSISLVGLIPLLTTDVTITGSDSSVSGRNASVEVQTFGIGGFGDLHLPFERIELSAGLGVLALLSSVRADPGELYVQAETPPPTQRLAALLGRVGVAWSMTPELRLSASIMGGLAVNDLKIEADREITGDSGVQIEREVVASWGRPLLMGTLSLELALPWER